jgi:hypothetical protein
VKEDDVVIAETTTFYEAIAFTIGTPSVMGEST